MFGIGFTELVLILIVALLVLGPEKLVALSKDAGRFLKELKRAASDVRSGIENVEENSRKNE
ncbi:MAG TPA: twin-arginine translocase TatA/TatE family subunit [Deltaproteobacteria bacterium]|nr:twin-arginine translocase TatA/TatE family subunit [Deltaproteobacteria bacterium]